MAALGAAQASPLKSGRYIPRRREIFSAVLLSVAGGGESGRISADTAGVGGLNARPTILMRWGQRTLHGFLL